MRMMTLHLRSLENVDTSALHKRKTACGRDGVKMPALSETLSPAVFLKRLQE